MHGLGLTNELPDVPHEYEAQGEDSLKIGTSQAVSSLLYTYSIQEMHSPVKILWILLLWEPNRKVSLLALKKIAGMGVRHRRFT